MISPHIEETISWTDRLANHFPYIGMIEREEMKLAYCSESSDLTNGVEEGFGEKVVSVLGSYGVDVSLHSVECGPVLVRVNVTPAVGVKVKSVESLSNELAINLKARSVSITLRPEIGCIAIDVPAADRKVVRPGNMGGEGSVGMELPLELGVGVTGETKVIDLAKTPHMLIAGQTGSGKSVCINSIIASLLKNVREDRYDLVLVDPKGVELGGYASLPNVVNHKVLVSPEDSLEGLKWLVKEMERRYGVLADAGCRNIKDFNRAYERGDEAYFRGLGADSRSRMRYVVCIVDEFADLMLNCGKELTECMMKLAQKSRAVGIHVILATQRPSVDVVTGALKANLPTCIAFKVKSAVDSMTIIGCGGAERLLGDGDMLLVTPRSDVPERVHGVYYSDESLRGMVDWIYGNTQEYIVRDVHFDTNVVFYTHKIGDNFVSAVLDRNEGMLGLINTLNKVDLHAQAESHCI